jgi:hypothetical protein
VAEVVLERFGSIGVTLLQKVGVSLIKDFLQKLFQTRQNTREFSDFFENYKLQSSIKLRDCIAEMDRLNGVIKRSYQEFETPLKLSSYITKNKPDYKIIQKRIEMIGITLPELTKKNYDEKIKGVKEVLIAYSIYFLTIDFIVDKLKLQLTILNERLNEYGATASHETNLIIDNVTNAYNKSLSNLNFLMGYRNRVSASTATQLLSAFMDGDLSNEVKQFNDIIVKILTNNRLDAKVMIDVLDTQTEEDIEEKEKKMASTFKEIMETSKVDSLKFDDVKKFFKDLFDHDEEKRSSVEIITENIKDIIVDEDNGKLVFNKKEKVKDETPIEDETEPILNPNWTYYLCQTTNKNITDSDINIFGYCDFCDHLVGDIEYHEIIQEGKK